MKKSRTAEELKEILTNIKAWYEDIFGEVYHLDKLKSGLIEVLHKRKIGFITNRLGHLPDNDLVALIDLMIKDSNVTSTAIPAETAISKGDKLSRTRK